MSRGRVVLWAATLFFSMSASAQELTSAQYLHEAQSLYESGQYFKAARYAFNAKDDPNYLAASYAWTAVSLIKAGLYNSASYFFIKTLQTGDKPAIKRVLQHTQVLLVRVGGDLLRKYLVRHTTYEDYDPINRSAYLYSLGKQTLLEGQEARAVGYIDGMSQQSPLWPFALQLRGSARAILGKNAEAIVDFRSCVEHASDYVKASLQAEDLGKDPSRKRLLEREAEDLRARCQAGEARTLYQEGKFSEADRAYDRIPKESLVWPDILFEQAWNSFARLEYNRTLGKLVTYKAPALTFVFNTEVDVLRAQTYLMLCLYSDSNDVINEFNTKHTKVGEEVKRFVEANATNLDAFFNLGKAALQDSLYTKNETHHMANRFVRGPYFQNLVAAEKSISPELQAVRQFASTQPGVRHESGRGFPGFLDLVLGWRVKTIRTLGGAFVKNSLLDYHSILISDFEKMAFIKLEMLSRAKERLIYRKAEGERLRGNVRPRRRDDQYFWSFNGEFWNDELGDYVFGLESECRG